MRVGLVGAGLQGRRRAQALKGLADTQLVLIASQPLSEAQGLAREMGCPATEPWQEVVNRDDIETVIVSTPPHLHAPISLAALEKGKHVLCEKPLGRNPQEAKLIWQASQRDGVTLKCGFNHRHYPAINQARQWVEEGLLGEICFLRCRYGIAGRPGYDREWRAQGEISGGGHLMDQGVHAIDLFRWFLGDFAEAFGFTATYFWDMAPLEDNAFALLRTGRGQVASLHTSLTQWKNLFSLEIFGREGYIQVEGLAGSYGPGRAILGRRDFSKPFRFREERVEFRGEDLSLVEEWKEFMAAIREKREPLGNGRDGYEAVRLAYAVYDSARRGSVVKL